MGNIFNHKYKDLHDALGISEERHKELELICNRAYTKTSCLSEAMEEVLSHGLSVIEVMYCGNALGAINVMQRSPDSFKTEVIGGRMVTPDGREIEISGDTAKLLKEMMDAKKEAGSHPPEELLKKIKELIDKIQKKLKDDGLE